MNRSFSKIRHIQESNIIFEKRVLNEELGDFDMSDFLKDGEKLSKDKMPDLINTSKSHFDAFYNKNKEFLDKYLHFKNKLAQLNFLENPKFSLSVINKTSNPQVVAKVKWPFEYNGKFVKNGYATLHIGGKKLFPQWLDTPNIYETSENIIRYKLLSNSSFPKD